mmetsp:Transcript_11082/g.33991  ORF Transcript_11082/g.33991 Transcript_11082/m.33991 type:complete len:214 (-) Transcript_11082:75-716(-)
MRMFGGLSQRFVKSHFQDIDPRLAKMTKQNTYLNRSETGTSVSLWNILLEELEEQVECEDDVMRLQKIRKQLNAERYIDTDEVARLSPPLMNRIAMEAYKVKEKKDFGVGRSFSAIDARRINQLSPCLSSLRDSVSSSRQDGSLGSSRKNSKVAFAREVSVCELDLDDSTFESVEEAPISMNALPILAMRALNAMSLNSSFKMRSQNEQQASA